MRGLVGDIPVETAKRNLYIETYGCAMNVADSEVVASIMGTQGFKTTNEMDDADVIFINTCAVRDNAEARIWGRLREMRNSKKQNKELIIGVLGCMAERLKKQLMEDEKIVDLVVGGCIPRFTQASGASRRRKQSSKRIVKQRRNLCRDYSCSIEQ